MGKADNTKRSIRINELIRKREQDALIAPKIGPAGIQINKRAALNVDLIHL